MTKKPNHQNINAKDMPSDLRDLMVALDQHCIAAITDPSGHVSYVNDKFRELIGEVNPATIDAKIEQFVAVPELDNHLSDIYKDVLKGNAWKGQVYVTGASGSQHWFDMSLTPITNAFDVIDRIIAIGSDIDELKQAQNQIASNNLRIQIANDSAGIGVWEWDLVTNELVWDEWMYSLYGIKEDQFSGVYEAWEQGVHPDDIGRASAMLQDAIEGNGVYDPEFRVVWPNGKIRILKASAEVLHDDAGNAVKVVGVNYDVTDRIRALEQLETAREQANQNALRMKLANDSAEIGVWEWDLITNDLVWDKWMYSLYGIKPEQFSGIYEAWEQGVHPDDLDRARTLLQSAIEGQAVYDPEFRVVWPSGEVRVLKASAEVLRDDSGKGIKVVGVNYDVTDRVKALELVQEAKEQAEEAAKAKSHFLANMSHEIRTPMNGVVGMLQVLKRADLNEEQVHHLDVAMGSAQSLLSLINDILDFSKIEAGKLDIEAIDFDLYKVLSNVIGTMSHLISDDADIKIVSDISGLSQQWVKGDPVRLQQILNNLISNAIKFTSAGEIKVSAQLVEMSDDRFRLSCSVNDTGLGIPESKLNQLFQEFEQADVSTTRKYGGTGLGLSICKKLCGLMGGGVIVKSEAGKGSCFTFDIVVGKASKNQNSTKRKMDGASESQMVVSSKPNDRVLLFEDNKVNQLVAKHMLNQIGLQVDVAENGLEGLAKLTESEKSAYSLIMMDCQMPEMDGYEATRSIRAGKAGDQYCDIPIIAMTANAMRGDKEKCLESGMNDYIAKPVEEREIRNTLAKWLNQA